jgi:hypothetical protein
MTHGPPGRPTASGRAEELLEHADAVARVLARRALHGLETLAARGREFAEDVWAEARHEADGDRREDANPGEPGSSAPPTPKR